MNLQIATNPPAASRALAIARMRGRQILVALAAVGLGLAPPTAAAAMQAQAAPAMPTASQLPRITPLPGPFYQNQIALDPSHTAKGPTEQWETYLGGPIVRNVINPTLIPLKPAAGKANGTAVIYAPGGGFRYLGMKDAELGKLTDQGITVFLLKYRLVPTDRDPPIFLKNLYQWLFGIVASNRQSDPAAGPALHATPEALTDGLAAVRFVRSHAGQWGIDPHRIGFMGASAGAMTAVAVAYTGADEARPDFIVALYGAKKVDPAPATAPPLFAASSVDDPLFPGSTENIVAAWSKANRPVEAHFYERGGHGLANGTTAESWFDGLVAWMKQHGWLPAPK